MIRRQQGAALLLFLVLLATAIAAYGAATLSRGSMRDARRMQDQQRLGEAIRALRSVAFARRCIDTTLPLVNLLPCPDGATTEGVAAPVCPAVARGWLPWRSLGLPPLQDSSGTCLWYERQGISARVIAAGAPITGQNRNGLAARPICGGNLTAANYLDAGDISAPMTLDTALLVARCP